MPSLGMNSSGSESVGMNNSRNERNPEIVGVPPQSKHRNRRGKCRSNMKAGGSGHQIIGSSTKQRATESSRKAPEKRKQRIDSSQQRHKHTRQSQQKLAAAAAAAVFSFAVLVLIFSS
jgi:hypothetical protein